jgi:MFS family permease
VSVAGSFLLALHLNLHTITHMYTPLRPAMMGAIVVLLGGSIAEITAHSWQTWLVAAVLVRLGVGLAQSILITYVSELSPFQIRGFMIGAYQLFIAIGQLISAVATQLITVHQPTVWKPLIGLEFIFTGVSPSHSTRTALYNISLIFVYEPLLTRY